MTKEDAVLDASFWINAYHGGLYDYLADYFTLYVPTIVIQEIEHTPPDVDHLTPAGVALRQWRRSGHLTIQDPVEPVDWYDPGENAAIALAREQEYLLLMDDQAPYHFVKARGMRVVASVDFAVLLYADNRLSYDDAQIALTQSGIAKHIKRSAMTALGFLARNKGQEHD